MKKFFTLAMMLTAVLFSGCIKDVTEVHEDYYVGSTVKSYYITAKMGNWQVYGEPGKEGCYMFQTFEFPEITETVMDQGFVTAFYCGKYGDTQLPYILPYDEGFGVIENIYCDYTQGSFSVMIESSDFSIVPRNADIQIKVVVVVP